MSQLEFFPTQSFAVTASLQFDGTWSMMLGTSADGTLDHTWQRDHYVGLSLGELFDIILASVY